MLQPKFLEKTFVFGKSRRRGRWCFMMMALYSDFVKKIFVLGSHRSRRGYRRCMMVKPEFLQNPLVFRRRGDHRWRGRVML
jgi:hypothetical protein